MTAEWAPSEPLLIEPAIAKEVAEAENLFQCAAAAHLLFAREVLEQNPGDKAAKAQGTFELQQHIRFREVASQKGDVKLAEIRARLAAQSDAEATAEAAHPENEPATPEKPKTLTETYLAHTTSFYSALADERFAAERTNRMPSDAVSRSNWATANVQMVEFALGQGDTKSASAYYGRIEDPVRQWALVAKVYTTDPILAKDWERPLAEKIEKHDFDAQTTLAMYKASLAMRLDQLKNTPKNAPEHATMRNEIHSVWIDAKQLLDRELQQQTMAPWQSWGKPVLPGHDVREHLVAFAELLYDKGEMQIAQEVTDVLKTIHKKVTTHQEQGDPDAHTAADNLLATTELCERCYGLTWNEVKQHAKDWMRDTTLSAATRAVCADIVRTQNPNLWDKYIMKHLPDSNQAARQAVCAYLEADYGVSSAVLPTGTVFDRESNTLPRHLQVTKTTTAFQQYYEVLSEATVLDRANSPSRRITTFERFQAALDVAKAAQQFETSGETQKTARILESINIITNDYQVQRRDAATDKLPDLQLETELQLDPYIKLEPGVAELDEKRYGALLDALKTVAPNGSAATNQLYKRIKEHCEFQLRALKAIPGETITGPRAEQLMALQARITQNN